MKFAILDSFTDVEIEKKICKDHEFVYYEARDERDLPDEISELDGCMVWHYVKLTEESFKRMSKCKVIVRIGVGFDSVDIEAAGKYGIMVCNVPDYGTNDVADHAYALLLSACRSITDYNTSLKNNILNSWDPSLGGNIYRLTNSTIGIIGLGRIGHAVAQRAKAFGMKVIYFDPYLPDGYDKSYLVERVNSLRELFEISDYISVHTPLTKETKGMVNKDLFKYSSKPFVLVNTARGGIVNLDDVYDALKGGIIRKFAADVLECEPPNREYRLIQAIQDGDDDICKRVIITPHSAFYAVESQIEMREKAALQLIDMAEGRKMRNCVNREYLVNAKYVEN